MTSARKLISRLRHRLRSYRQFYSPVVNPHDPRVIRTVTGQATASLPESEDLRIDRDALLAALHKLSAFYADLPFSETQNKGMRYFFENPMFSYGDAIVLFGMMRWHRPSRIVEVGCGYSSGVLMDTNDLFFDRSIELTFIDPYPATLLKILSGDDSHYKGRLLMQPLQDVPLNPFTALRANDMLLLDSSHVSKVASDVNDYFFRILPALAPGVLIHIHDIPYPFEYPPQWVVDDGRSWNEAYLLRCFLQYNPRFRIEYFNHFMFREYPALVLKHMPLCGKNCGAGIWIRKL